MQPADDRTFDEIDAAPENPGPVRVLVASPDCAEKPHWLRIIRKAGHSASASNSFDDARRALSDDTFDALVLHAGFDEDAAMRLARHVQRCQLASRVVLVSTEASFEVAVEAMRAGIVDVVHPTVDDESFIYTIECAAHAAREDRRREQRHNRTRDLCRKLNAAKIESSKQVEVLCRDLANAYEDIADQINEVAMSSEFRTLLAQELDLESLLRTALEYMLTKIGPTNAAVFLPDFDRNYSLGAYVNYNCPRETADMLLQHLCEDVCPHMEEEPDIIRFEDTDELAEWLGSDTEFLQNSDVVAFSCHNDDECLAVMVLFRDKKDPFRDDLPQIIDTLRSIFARQVASVIRVHHRAKPVWPAESAEDVWEDDEFGFGLAA